MSAGDDSAALDRMAAIRDADHARDRAAGHIAGYGLRGVEAADLAETWDEEHGARHTAGIKAAGYRADDALRSADPEVRASYGERLADLRRRESDAVASRREWMSGRQSDRAREERQR